MLAVFTHTTITRLRRRISKLNIPLDLKADLLAEISFLAARYAAEVCTTISPWPGSRSLLHWRAYFHLNPGDLNVRVKERLAYARGTKVEFHVSAELKEQINFTT